MRLAKPKQSVGRIADVANPCFACEVSCCSAFRIYISAFDLKRITENLGVSAIDVCLPVQYSEETRDHAHLTFSLGEEERFLLALRRRASGCLFLMKVGPRRRCGIHGARPLVCRSYPLVFHRGQTGMTRQALCPAPWSVSGERNVEWGGLHKQRSSETMLYQAFLENWNEEGLPALVATGLPTLAFQARFRFFLDFLAKGV